MERETDRERLVVTNADATIAAEGGWAPAAAALTVLLAKLARGSHGRKS